MKKEIKEKFVAALRSKEYSQTTDKLKNGNCFCAMGVLCDLFIKEHDCAWWEGDSISVNKTIGRKLYELCAYELPEAVEVWSGLLMTDQLISKTGESEPIANLNDNGLSFEQIASLIESQL